MKKINEGSAEIFVEEGDPTKELPVFYNPEMEENRNITISVLNSYFKDKFIACDPLAGSGVRGIRISKETKAEKIVMNDITTLANQLIKKNVKLNKAKNIEVEQKDAKILLFENKHSFDFIDIDPFGSPVQFLEASGFAIKRGGLFAATATDTGPLAGSFAKTCYRKYGVKVCKTDFYKELGVRVLITKIQKTFAIYKATFNPLLSYSNHFFRVFGSIEIGKSNVDKNLEKIGYISYCQSCLNRELDFAKSCGLCKKQMFVIGPIWLGKIQDNKFIKNVNKEQGDRGFKKQFVEEIDQPACYDLHRIFKKNKISSVKKETIINGLVKAGFYVSETNFCPTGIKTNANVKEIVKLLK